MCIGRPRPRSGRLQGSSRDQNPRERILVLRKGDGDRNPRERILVLRTNYFPRRNGSSGRRLGRCWWGSLTIGFGFSTLAASVVIPSSAQAYAPYASAL